MKPQVTGAAGDGSPDEARITGRETPGDGAGGDASVIVSALDKVRDDYAAELRYRRLVAWIACLIVAVLLLGAVVGGYLHRDRVAVLERDNAAARSVADERADTIHDLRGELAAARRIEVDLRSKLAIAQQAADSAEGRATALRQQVRGLEATITALRSELDRERQQSDATARRAGPTSLER